MNRELEQALEIAEKDAADWTSQDAQILAETYKNAWDNKDCKALEALSTAMCDVSYGKTENTMGLFDEYDYKRNYSIVPSGDKYAGLLDALDSNKEGELYYTLSRISMIPTETKTVVSDYENECIARFTYDFESTANGMQVMLSTSAQGVPETNLYTITSVDMNEVVPATCVNRLKSLGYGENEITTLKASALTDTDVNFIGNLAAGNYEAAYRVDPSGLSDFTKVELSAYQAILGTRADAEVCNAEMQRQINILYDQDLDHIINGPANNAYPEYVSIIAGGLQLQSQKYGENMEELYDNKIYIPHEYFDYGDDLNRTVALWDSFDTLSRVSDVEWLERLYGLGLREGAFDLQVADLQVSTLYGQYQYKVNVVDGKTGELLPEQYGMEVELQKLSAINALREGYVAENIKNAKELENIKKNTVINASSELVDGLFPFPLKDTFELANAVQDVVIDTSDVTSSLKMASNVGMLDSENETLSAVGKVSKVAGSVFNAIGSGIKDYKKTQAEIEYNNEYLKYSFNGQLSQMKFYMGLETGGGETQVFNVGRNCMAPEVQYNMIRWQKEGIGAYLKDVGLGDKDRNDFVNLLDVVKLESELKDVATPEEVAEAVDILLNGGNIANISEDVRTKIQEKIDSFAKDGKRINPPTIDSWLEQRNIPNYSEVDRDELLVIGSPQLVLNNLEPKLTILEDEAGNLCAVEGISEKEWRTYCDSNLKLKLNDDLAR